MKLQQLLFLLILFSACKGRADSKDAIEEIIANAPAATHMNTGKDPYKLDVPEGWTTEHRSAYGIDYYFLFAPKTKEDPNTNINVLTESIQGLTLTEYRRKSIESIKRAVPDAEILNQGNIQANGIDGVWYSYTMSPGGSEASLVCYMFSKNGSVYSITAGTIPKHAARYRKLFDKVAMSIKFY